MYYAIKNLYASPVSCVIVNDRLTEWFPVESGVRQGDSLSPTLFAIFINDLAEELTEQQLGVRVGEYRLQIQMYAGDIVNLGEKRKQDLHCQMDTVSA